MLQRTLWVGLLLTLSVRPVAADDLQSLRDASANHYFDPAAHLALAKYQLDQGNRLTAFFLVEGQRRKSPDHVFPLLFRKVFVDVEPFDNSAEAEASLQRQIEANPKDSKALFKLADIYISRSDWPRAQPKLRQALELAPDDYSIRGALEEVLRRQEADAEADKLEAEFLSSYPDSLEGYLARISAVAKEDPEKAKALVNAALELYPDNGNLHFYVGAMQEGAKDATKSFVKAASLSKRSAQIQGWVGRYFLKTARDPEAALEYYLNAYFLEPDFYETEFAESRIRSIAWGLAEGALADLPSQGPSGWMAILRQQNPVVVSRALKLLSSRPWQEELLAPLVDLMASDDETVRWAATELLKDKAGPAIRPQLPELLTAKDLRQRGLAAYLAVPLMGKESYGAIREFLASNCELLRYDAISALIMAGDADALAILAEHKSHETHPALLEILDSRGI